VLEELTFGVELFLPLSVRRGQSACVWWTVCGHSVRRVHARLRFRSGFVLGFCCSWFADGPSFSSGRSGSRADGPPGLRRWSVFLGTFLVVLLALTDCPRLLAGLSTTPGRTVRMAFADSPPLPGRTIRLCLTALLLGSFPPFFSFVLPHVLQGIVPET
jgi:hypothetical protein